AEMFLRRSGETGSFLRIAGQKRKRGEIQQARPALAECSRNLRDSQLPKRKWSRETLVKAYGRIDFSGEAFQLIGWTWLEGWQLQTTRLGIVQRGGDGAGRLVRCL